MSELAVRTPAEVGTYLSDPTGGRLIAWAEAAAAANSLAKALVTTTFVPAGETVGNATAKILMGDELGLSPIAALRSIYVVHGTPALYARSMVALALSHGHLIWTEETSDAKVVVCGQRRGSDHVERAEWTIARATKAGYTANKKYGSNPQEMLYSKAAGEIARKVAPDTLAGIPFSVEDLELGEVATVTVSREPAAPKRVARAPKPEPVEPEFDEPVVDATETAAPAEPVTVEPEPAPEQDGITPAQLKKMAAGMRDAGITERGHALAYVAQVIGREVESRNDLTKAEASRVIDALESDTDSPSDADYDAMGARAGETS